MAFIRNRALAMEIPLPAADDLYLELFTAGNIEAFSQLDEKAPAKKNMFIDSDEEFDKEAWVTQNINRYHNFGMYGTQLLTQAIVAVRQGEATRKKERTELLRVIKKTEKELSAIIENQLRILVGQTMSVNAQRRGYSTFGWRSRRDRLVRHVHVLADGQRYSLSLGHPTEGLPGQPIRCRCDMEDIR
jgi:uncharacterized protein with gpF-like domain